MLGRGVDYQLGVISELLAQLKKEVKELGDDYKRYQKFQGELQANGENIRPNEEETREGSGEQVGGKPHTAKDVSANTRSTS